MNGLLIRHALLAALAAALPVGAQVPQDAEPACGPLPECVRLPACELGDDTTAQAKDQTELGQLSRQERYRSCLLDRQRAAVDCKVRMTEYEACIANNAVPNAARPSDAHPEDRRRKRRLSDSERVPRQE